MDRGLSVDGGDGGGDRGLRRHRRRYGRIDQTGLGDRYGIWIDDRTCRVAWTFAPTGACVGDGADTVRLVG
ncbi:hypothetical protein [Ensifer sp. ENS02]|uniref:hypothetical protein n=1 Tax=Ensifer sp. ENS02 TaxID=2769290 RepID=UPI001AEDB18C|nr:hypothetical protein [Ensifer sp. ENS02]